MNTLIKIVTTLLILNIFMYIVVNFSISADGVNSLNKNYNFHFENDLITNYLTGNTDFDTLAQNTKENWTDYGVGLNSNVNKLPTKETGTSVGSGGINFLDALAIAWDFVGTLFNIVISPLTLFFNFNMPIFIGLLIGFPYFTILLLCIFGFIRGSGD